MKNNNCFYKNVKKKMNGENNEEINSKLLVRDRLVLLEKFVLFHLMFEIIFYLFFF